jgi:hypothetical protein
VTGEADRTIVTVAGSPATGADDRVSTSYGRYPGHGTRRIEDGELPGDGPFSASRPQTTAHRAAGWNSESPAGSRSRPGLHDGRNGARRHPEDRRQTMDRDDKHVLLTPLHSTSSNETQDRQSAAATPSSPAPRQPGRLLVQTGEVTSLVGPGFWALLSIWG